MNNKTKKDINIIKILGFFGFFLVFYLAFFAYTKPVLAVTCGDTAGIGGIYRECQCGDNMTTNYTMKKDLFCPPVGFTGGLGDPLHSGFIIGDNNTNNAQKLVLDCAAYHIRGFTSPNIVLYGPYFGVKNFCSETKCRENIEIKNCKIDGFDNAIFIVNTSQFPTIKDIWIHDNSFPNSLVSAEFGYASADYGINNIIEKNIFWDSSGGALYVKNIGDGSSIKNNRIIARPTTAYGALWINNAKNMEVYGNFVDCHKVSASDMCSGDVNLDGTINNINIYDNIFAGTGIQKGGRFGLTMTNTDWCATPGVSPTKKNIFGSGATPPTASDCSTCGGVCAKACIDNTINRNDTYPLTENTCLVNNQNFDFTNLPSKKPAFATQDGNYDNIMLFCDQTYYDDVNNIMKSNNNAKIFGNADNDTIGMRIGSIVYNADESVQSYDASDYGGVIGCNFENFRKGIQINNSQNAFLRENIAGVSLDNNEKIYYYYDIVATPLNDPNYKLFYNHFLYNPYSLENAAPDSVTKYYRSIYNYIGNGAIPNFKKVIYYYNEEIVSDIEKGYNEEITSSKPRFQNVGHITLAFVKGVSLHDMTYDHGDPITIVGSSGKDPYNVVSLRDIYSNTVSNNGKEGMRIIKSTDLKVYSNVLEDNLYGMLLSGSDHLTVYLNNAASNKKDSYGLVSVGTKESAIGGSLGGNTFNSNMGAGMYMTGLYYYDIAPTVNEKNEISNNSFDNNGLWGAILTNVGGNTFKNNTVKSNGTAESGECTDAKDNDGDALIDAADIDCVDSGSRYESYPSGLYINFAYNNLFDTNDVSLNLGDNIMVDSSILRLPNDLCPGNILPLPDATSNNIFVNNIITGTSDTKARGNGIFVTAGSSGCPEDLPAGGVVHNAIGYFFLNTNTSISRSFYDSDPNTLGDSLNNNAEDKKEKFNFIPLPGNNASLPVWGGNTITLNYGHGILFGSSPRTDKASRIYYNDIYGNTITSNKKDGIHFTGYRNPNNGFNFLKFNDIIKNSIQSSQKGIYASASVYSRILGNAVDGNSAAGIQIKDTIYNNLTDYQFVEIGHASSCPVAACTATESGGTAGIDYLNTLQSNGAVGSGSQGIGVLTSDYTRVVKNRVERHDYPIYVAESSNVTIESNYINIVAAGIYNVYGVYLTGSQNATLTSNTITNFTKYGIKGFQSNSATLQKNIIQYGKVGSIGLAIADSTGWKVGDGAGNGNSILDMTPAEAGIIPRYLYVGPDLDYATTTNPYPYDWSGSNNTALLSYYNHTITTQNIAGPNASSKKIYYIYDNKIVKGDGSSNNVSKTLDGNDGANFPDLKNTFHLQITNSSDYSLKNLVLNSSDPLELDFFTFSGNDDSITLSTFQNCRGECISLYALKKQILGAQYLIQGSDGVSTVLSKDFNGIIARAVSDVKFDTLTVETTNPTNYAERGGIYLYNSQNNTLISNKFKFSDGRGLVNRQWELFLAGDSKNNTIEKNTFSYSGANNGTGAYELRSGLPDEIYPTINQDYSVANDLVRASDGICRIDSTDGVCDPNCDATAKASDIDCNTVTCANTSENCCSDVFNSNVDPDCPFGLDPDYAAKKAVPAITRIADDGICVNNNDSRCDINCTSTGNSSCMTSIYPGDGCYPAFGDGCDYDCPRGVDPDCVAQQNTWCDPNDNTLDNTFSYIINTKINYFESLLTSPNGNGGGGIPNDAKFCYYPRARFNSSSSIAQKTIDRNVNLATRAINVFKFDVNSGEFLDLYGLDGKARIRISSNQSSWTTGISNFSNISVVYDNFTPDQLIPTANTVGTHRLGALEAGKNPIKNFSINQSIYPTSPDPWATYKTQLNFIWNANSMKTGTFNAGSPTYNGNRCDATTASCWWAQLEIINKKNKSSLNSTYSDLDEVELTYDFDGPGNTQMAAPTAISSNDASCVAPKKKYQITWIALATTEPAGESNWGSSNQGHYEIWYGNSKAEVDSRAESDGSSLGPFVFDDLATHSSGLPYESSISPSYDAVLATQTNNSAVVCSNLVGAVTVYWNICAVDKYGNENCSSVPAAQPYVETRYGNIYSGGNIGSVSEPSSKNSATFLIQAVGAIENWSSLNQVADSDDNFPPDQQTMPGYAAYPAGKILPQKSNNYTVSFASLDFLNQATAGYETAITKELKSRYGDGRFEKITDAGQIDSILGGKIYYYEGNLTISSSKTFNVGTAGTPNASGLIIVNGNLTINSNILYQNLAVTKVANIPSAAWLVLGDITVIPAVDTISGAFFALGDVANPCTVNCGTFNTGNDTGAYKQLKVNGLIMAQTLDFQRRYTGSNGASELIIYDGRLQANPPLGMEDFMRGLPKWIQ